MLLSCRFTTTMSILQVHKPVALVKGCGRMVFAPFSAVQDLECLTLRSSGTGRAAAAAYTVTGLSAANTVGKKGKFKFLTWGKTSTTTDQWFNQAIELRISSEIACNFGPPLIFQSAN